MNYRFQIGEKVSIIGSGETWGLVVDFIDSEQYVIAFKNGKEIIFPVHVILKKGTEKI